MQALIANGRYKVTEVLHSAGGYDACLCTDVMVNTGKTVIVNTYSAKEYIRELLPLFFAINQKGMSDFIELITADGSISAVFDYHKGTPFAEYYPCKKGETRDFEQSMTIAENLLMRSLELDLADDRIAFCALNEQNIVLDTVTGTARFNFRVHPETAPEPMFRGRLLGELLGKMFPKGRYLPAELEQFIDELCSGKYPTCSAAFSRWREISEAAKKTHAEYEKESFVKYLSRKIKQKKKPGKS